MEEDKLDGVLAEWVEGYNSPPETPREEIWERLQAHLSATPSESTGVVSLERERGRRRRSLHRVAPLAAAAAALLVLGFGLGRMGTVPGASGVGDGDGGIAAPVAAAPPVSSTARMAAFQHLSRSGALLSLVSADAKAGRLDAQVGEWGRGLLMETRLLLDSRSVADPALRELLEDLELILAQVALLSDGGGEGEGRAREELRLVADGLEEQDVLSRIQAVTPAVPGFTTM